MLIKAFAHNVTFSRAGTFIAHGVHYVAVAKFAIATPSWRD